MSRVPRICVIGGGTFGIMHLRTFRQLADAGKCEFCGLADINASLLEKRSQEFRVRTYGDYVEMIAKEKPDGVTVATPDHLHRKIALEAMKRGVHVLVEKPLDVTVEGCLEMMCAAEAKDLLLEVDFHKRYDPYHQELCRLAREGKFGEIEYGYAWMEDRIEVPRDWWPDWAKDSSPAWFLAVHMIDLFLWCAQTTGKRVYATGVRKKLASMNISAWDSINIFAELDRDITFQCQVSWILPDSFEAIVNQGIRILGTEGMMEVDSQNRGAESCFESDGTMTTYNLGFLRETRDKSGKTVYSGYGIEAIADFASNVQFLLNGGELTDLRGTYPDSRDGLEATRIVAAAHESLSTRKLVEIG